MAMTITITLMKSGACERYSVLYRLGCCLRRGWSWYLCLAAARASQGTEQTWIQRRRRRPKNILWFASGFLFCLQTSIAVSANNISSCNTVTIIADVQEETENRTLSELIPITRTLYQKLCIAATVFLRLHICFVILKKLGTERHGSNFSCLY